MLTNEGALSKGLLDKLNFDCQHGLAYEMEFVVTVDKTGSN